MGSFAEMSYSNPAEAAPVTDVRLWARPGGDEAINGVMVDGDFCKGKDIWEDFEKSNDSGDVGAMGGMVPLLNFCSVPCPAAKRL